VAGVGGAASQGDLVLYGSQGVSLTPGGFSQDSPAPDA